MSHIARGRYVCGTAEEPAAHLVDIQSIFSRWHGHSGKLFTWIALLGNENPLLAKIISALFDGTPAEVTQGSSPQRIDRVRENGAHP